MRLLLKQVDNILMVIYLAVGFLLRVWVVWVEPNHLPPLWPEPAALPLSVTLRA